MAAGSVSPSSGTADETFTYEVTYTDVDGEAPTHIRTVIDGTAHGMTRLSGDYWTGATYQYNWSPTGDDVGIPHSYYFEASDGTNWARLPTSGSYDGPTVTAGAQSTTLSVSPLSFTLETGESVILTATLKDGANNPLAGKTIDWYLGTVFAARGTTDSSGQVSIIYPAPTVTAQTQVTLTASFAGDDLYRSSSGSSSGTIRPPGVISTLLSISPSSFTLLSGDSTTLTATLTDNNGNPVSGKTITWTKQAGTLSAISGTTNSSGQVSITYTAPVVTTSMSVAITASFAGDDRYSSSTGSSTGTIRSGTYQEVIAKVENYLPPSYTQFLTPYIEDVNVFVNVYQSILAKYPVQYCVSLLENFPCLARVYSHLDESDPLYTKYRRLVDGNLLPPSWVSVGWIISEYSWVPLENWEVPKGWVPPTTWTVPENWIPTQAVLNHVVPPWMPRQSWIKPENWLPAMNWVPPENWAPPEISVTITAHLEGMFSAAMGSIQQTVEVIATMPSEYHWVPPRNRPFWAWVKESIAAGAPVHFYIAENSQPWMRPTENALWTQVSAVVENAEVGGITITPRAPIDNLVVTVTPIDRPEDIPPPQANVCTYMLMGTNASENIENAEVGFKIRRSWVTANDLNENTLGLQRYTDGAWTKLSTTIVGQDENYIYCEAQVPGFSVFVVTGGSGETEVLQVVEIQVVAVVAAGIGVLVAAFVIVWWRRRTKRRTREIPPLSKLEYPEGLEGEFIYN